MIEVRIPPLGESVTQGVIARWLKRDGDTVQADEPLLELETDKATVEIVADRPGRLQIVTPEGATVEVGTVVARIDDTAAAPEPAVGDGHAAAPATPPAPAPAPPPGPAARKLAAEHAIDPATLSGSGKGGRVTKADVLERIETARAAPPADGGAPAAPAPEPGPAPADTPSRPAEADVERVPLTALRRRIAQRLVEAQHTAAILTTFNEVDLSELLALRRRHRERFQKKHGVDLGLMSLFSRATVLALRDVPVVNARIEGDEIVYHRRVHLGIAVSTPRGLVVPVVRDADGLTIAELEREIGRLATRAREGKLLPDDLAGGTFTITNGGVFGSLLSTPLLNPPQSGILGMHKIQERPVAVGGEVVIRSMMYLALSYDHRLVDGEQAVTSLVRVKEHLEDPARMLLEV